MPKFNNVYYFVKAFDSPILRTHIMSLNKMIKEISIKVRELVNSDNRLVLKTT